MRILLKDHSLAHKVVRKIIDKYPSRSNKLFAIRTVPAIESILRDGRDVILYCERSYDLQTQKFIAELSYEPVEDIPTDTEFLNKKIGEIWD